MWSVGEHSSSSEGREMQDRAWQVQVAADRVVPLKPREEEMTQIVVLKVKMSKILIPAGHREEIAPYSKERNNEGALIYIF
jgi:hypothetical protein